MIRRSPAEAYLRYLVLHPKKYTNAQIIEICQFAQVDYLGPWYLDRLRAQLTPPKPFFPFDPDHPASRNFLLRNSLAPLFTPDDAGRKAFKILELPRVKEFVEASLISNAPVNAIAYMATRQHRFVCSPQVIDRFAAFFWDLTLVDSSELRGILQLRYAQLENHADADIKKHYDLMKRAYYQDARKKAADLPFSPLSAMLAQMQMGILPSKLDVAKIMDQARGYAASRVAEATLMAGRGDSVNALNYAIVTEKMTNVLKDMVSPDEDLQKQLASIALRTADDAIPTIHALSAGKGTFTTDTGPKEIAHELPADVDDEGAGAGDVEPAG